MNILTALTILVLVLSAYTAISVGRIPKSVSDEVAKFRQYPVTIDDFMDNYEDVGMYSMTGALALHKYDRGEAVILDVRSEDLRQNGYILESLHIPFTELLRRMGELPKNENIIVYCENNINSAFATMILEMHGYYAYVLEGGIDAWIAAGGETTMETPPPRRG